MAAACDEIDAVVDAAQPVFTRFGGGHIVGVFDDEGIIHQRACGHADAACTEPITSDVRFDLTCLSKQFIGMAVALLEAEGRLSVSAPVSTYVPQLQVRPDDMRVSDLVAHTSGLRDLGMLQWLTGYGDRPAADAFALLKRQTELAHEPGQRFMYSNTGYFLLARIIQHVTRRPVSEWVEMRVFAAAGMSCTRMSEGDGRVLPDHAVGFDTATGFARRAVHAYPEAGVFSSLADLAAWHRYLCGASGGQREVVRRFHSCGTLRNGRALPYAYGLSIQTHGPDTVVLHKGRGHGNSHVYLRLLEKRIGVAILSTRGGWEPTPVALAILDRVAGTQLSAQVNWTETTGLRPRRSAPPSAPLAYEVRGRYYSVDVDTSYHVEPANGDLVVSWPNTSVTLKRESATHWSDGRIRVAFDATGHRAGAMIISSPRLGRLRCPRHD